MITMAFQITSLMIVYQSLYSGANQRKHQSSVSLAFVGGIHRWPVNSSHKGPVTRKMFPFGDVVIDRHDAIQDNMITSITMVFCIAMIFEVCEKYVMQNKITYWSPERLFNIIQREFCYSYQLCGKMVYLKWIKKMIKHDMYINSMYSWYRHMLFSKG